MNVRSIQHPGVEAREIDLSEYFAGPASVNTNNAYVMGFTDRGPIYDYSWITSEAQFVAIYGSPTNEAERYLYYAMKSILDNGGNAIVARMPYDNKQCKCYKGLTLTYGVNKGVVGDYIGTEVYSNALIDLDDAAAFIGKRIKDDGLTQRLFPRYSTVNITYQIPQGYLTWQFLAAVSANFQDLSLLAKASTFTKLKLFKDNELRTFVSGTSFLNAYVLSTGSWGGNLTSIENLFSYEDFNTLYNGFREQYDTYTLQNDLALFQFDQVNFTSPCNPVNGIILESKTGKLTNVTDFQDGFNTVFNATTPLYITDDKCFYGEQKSVWTNNASGYTYGFEETVTGTVKVNGLNTCPLTISDILVGLNTTSQDYINFGTSSEPDLFYRGETENFMSIKVPVSTFLGYIGKPGEDGTAIVDPTFHIDLTEANIAYAKSFTINGVKPGSLGVTAAAISSVVANINAALTRTDYDGDLKPLLQYINLSTCVSCFYPEFSSLSATSAYTKIFMEDVFNVGFTDIARVYNHPNLYKFTDEAVASIDANLLLEESVNFKKMAALVSEDVVLSNYQYDCLVTTQNFEAQPDGDGNSVYNNLGCNKINNANYVIVDKLKTIANGSQNNNGYFVTVIDPFDALKIQRLLVNPYDDKENVFETSDIRFWGMDSNLAWGKQFDTANNTMDTLKRVCNADGIWVGEPGKGSKTNIMDSWSVPLTGYYKNESISKSLMKSFSQISLVTNNITHTTTIDKAFASHIVVAVCRTGVNPSDGKIAVNIVETFFGSIFDEYDDITGETVYIGNLINEKSNYIEFYKNMYTQPGFGGVNSKEPYNKTTVNQMYLKNTPELNNAAALVGVDKNDYDVNEDFVPGNTQFMFDTKAEFEQYIKEHSSDPTYPAKAGIYYFKPSRYLQPGAKKGKSYWSDGTKNDERNYDPNKDSIIVTCTVTLDEDGHPKLSPISMWKKDYGAFEYALKKHNVYVFNKNTTCLYNLFQNAKFTSFSQKECEKKIANTTGIYSPVYGISQKVTSNFVQDMDYCIKFIQNTDEIPIYFVADAGMSTIGQFCDNINWDSKNQMWITQSFDPDNDPDVEDHQITSKDDVESWWKIVNKLDSIASSIRKDCMTIIDAPRMMTIDGMAPKMRPSAWKNDFDELIGKKLRFISGMNSSYSAGYLTWFRMYDKFTNKAFWLPPTCKLIGNLVYLNSINLPWLAPAGTTYGVINDIHAISLNPCASEEDQIYLKNWNYCKQYPIEGFVIEGQKTMLTKNSAFNRINVRTLFLDIERYVANVARNYRYKVNNQFTREQFTNTIKSKLEDYTTRGGITDFLIKCDETLNTPEVIDNNQLRMAIYIKPGRLIEYVLVDYVCCKTGANFEEITY